MGRELKLFLLAVGLPSAILLLLVLRFATLEKRHPAALRGMRGAAMRPRMEMRNPPPDAPPHEAPPGPHRRLGPLSADYEGDRFAWIIACAVALALLSSVSGAWLLMKSARKAREESLRKTDFLSNISHEFKTPLTTICLCAELAQDEGLGEERRQKALRAILSESGRLKSLVLDALDFSRLEKGRRKFAREACDLAEIAASVAEPMRESLPNLELETDPGEQIRADAGAIRQIVANLLDNERKYADKAKPVRLKASGHVLEVSDGGPGMPREKLKRIFDRFWRGEDALTGETGGSGLGLSIARELARGMGGELSVACNREGGLSFRLEL